MMEPNWKDIERCPILRHLGVIQCMECSGKDECWPDSDIEEIDFEEVAKFIDAIRKCDHR